MSQREMERLIGTAIVEPGFRDLMLNGARKWVIADFDLTAEEREAILGIQAGTLQGFAQALWQWASAREEKRPAPVDTHVGQD